MKKVIITCAAVVLALGLMSCGDTKACYKLTTSGLGVELERYVYGTSNDIDLYIANWKKALGDNVEIKRSTLPNLKSEDDCTGTSVRL